MSVTGAAEIHVDVMFNVLPFRLCIAVSGHFICHTDTASVQPMGLQLDIHYMGSSLVNWNL